MYPDADLQANNVKNLDTPEAKLGWMFDAYDADGGGTVDAEEITSIVVGLFRSVSISASISSIRRFVIMEKAPTRAFSWLKAPTSAFTLKTLLRHYA